MKYIVDGVVCYSVTSAVNTLLDVDRALIHRIIKGLEGGEYAILMGTRVRAVADDE